MSYPHLSTDCAEHHALVADGPTAHVLDEVRIERLCQDVKWKEQNHPDGTGEAFKREADLAKADTDRAARNGTLTWRHILWEEVAEAFAESDPLKLRAELVQVAASAAVWVEHLDRRQAQVIRDAFAADDQAEVSNA